MTQLCLSLYLSPLVSDEAVSSHASGIPDGAATADELLHVTPTFYLTAGGLEAHTIPDSLLCPDTNLIQSSV